MLQNEYLDAKICVDKDENEPSKVCLYFVFISSLFRLYLFLEMEQGSQKAGSKPARADDSKPSARFPQNFRKFCQILSKFSEILCKIHDVPAILRNFLQFRQNSVKFETKNARFTEKSTIFCKFLKKSTKNCKITQKFEQKRCKGVTLL